jgi:hypothetical protein
MTNGMAIDFMGLNGALGRALILLAIVACHGGHRLFNAAWIRVMGQVDS